jgi:hypothetical protein
MLFILNNLETVTIKIYIFFIFLTQMDANLQNMTLRYYNLACKRKFGIFDGDPELYCTVD